MTRPLETKGRRVFSPLLFTLSLHPSRSFPVLTPATWRDAAYMCVMYPGFQRSGCRLS